MLDANVIAAHLPPSKLFIVSSKRVRAGKGSLCIFPTAWFIAHGGVKCGVYVNNTVYSLDACFIDLVAASEAVSDLVDKERQKATQKLNELFAQLEIAKARELLKVK
jgi:hypothetical protein